MDNILTLDKLDVAIDGTTIVSDINFTLKRGEIGCLLGPSGCGKTTILRAIAGFQNVSKGHLFLDGTNVSDTQTCTPPEARNIGMVFQDFALFPHLTVSQNITFGISRLKKAEQQQRAKELLELVGLPEYAKRYPHELSGGQQQRIALARALAPKPKLLLLDEPFGSQDVEIREHLAADVRRILLQENISAILVTHDQNEAFVMADEVGVISAGKLVQWGPAYQLYHHPANRFVASFIGHGEMLRGTAQSHNDVKTALGHFSLPIAQETSPGNEVDILIRPSDIKISATGEHSATIQSRAFRGSDFLYTLQLESGESVVSVASSEHPLNIGDQVNLALDLEHLVSFPVEH